MTFQMKGDFLKPMPDFNDSHSREAWLYYNTTLLANLHHLYVRNRAVDDNAFVALVTTYCTLIVTGATGNGLVCLVVACKPQMRTARNVFIINLAIADLLLCLFTMPFTLTQILFKVWPLGKFMCKMVSSLQAISIYVSTMSITAIALDRYNAIVYPTREWTKRLGSVAILSSIWSVAVLLALPLFIYHTVDHHYVGLPQLEYVEYCYEEWPGKHGRVFYSVGSMIFQYVLPIAIVGVTYALICRKLQRRMSTKVRLNNAGQIKDSDMQRIKKTNLLLISIAVIFVLSWLPLNCLNLMTDLDSSLITSDRTFRVVFASCHMIGMSSACSNPLLYGWLNDNFRKEFKEVFSSCYGCFSNYISPVLPNNDTSPVPLVLYTRHSSLGNEGRVSIATYSKIGYEDVLTVVTQVTTTTT